MCCDEGNFSSYSREYEDKGFWSVTNILLFNQVMNDKPIPNIPVCYDNLPDLCNPSGMQVYADKYTAIQDNAKLCQATWPDGITPVFHLDEGKEANQRAHEDYLLKIIIQLT